VCVLDSNGSEHGSVVGSCKHGNEPSGFTKHKELLDKLSNYHPLKKASAPCHSLIRSRFSGHFIFKHLLSYVLP
jgi:hypothetical protein